MSRTSDQRRMEREHRLEEAVLHQEKSDLATLMARPDFRRYLYATAFRRGRLEALAPLTEEARCLHEGRRGLAYELAQQALEVAPHEYVLMRKEAVDDSLARLAQLEAIEGDKR